MKERLVVGGLVLLALTALKKPELFRTLARKLKLVLFDDDRPVIRVRTGSLDVECCDSEFSTIGTDEWEHVPKKGKTSGRPEVAVVAFGAGQIWAHHGKKVVVAYDAVGLGSSVTFHARHGGNVRIKAVGNLKKQSDTLLQDVASNVTITSLEVDHNGPTFAVEEVLIF